MNKKQALGELREKIEEDKTLPLRENATRLVFGEGNPDAWIYFLGEAPGYWEDQKGRPFVGQAGQLLDQLIESINLKREDVYISNVVRFRPPQNRDPQPEEIVAFQPYVNEEIDIIQPKIIVTLGRFSLNKFLPNEKISQVHGKVRVVRWGEKDLVVIPMYHPAAALRNRETLIQLKEDFKKIKEVLETPLKESGGNEQKSAKQLSLI